MGAAQAKTVVFPKGDTSSYPWARVGTAVSLALALHFNGSVPNSCICGIEQGNGAKALDKAQSLRSQGKLAEASLVLEPYETFYRSRNLHASLVSSAQVKADLHALLDLNIPLIEKRVRGSQVAEEIRVGYDFVTDTVVGDPDLTFRDADGAITIVETKTTIRPSLGRLLQDAIRQLILLAVFSANPQAPVRYRLVLHLARQGRVIDVPIESDEIHTLSLALDKVSPYLRY
jgi:hypothetical protein